jgi:hypothetical protein
LRHLYFFTFVSRRANHEAAIIDLIPFAERLSIDRDKSRFLARIKSAGLIEAASLCISSKEAYYRLWSGARGTAAAWAVCGDAPND